MLKTQDYLDLVERLRKEIEAFPLKRALEKLGANDISECVTISGVGDIVLKKDAPRFMQMIKDQHNETMDALKDKDFTLAAFLYEMDNHEYTINYDGNGNVLGCFGLEADDLEKMGLETVYQLARKKLFDHMRELGVFLMVKKGE